MTLSCVSSARAGLAADHSGRPGARPAAPRKLPAQAHAGVPRPLPGEQVHVNTAGMLASLPTPGPFPPRHLYLTYLMRFLSQ